jgi:hypothetical protein
MSEVETVYSRNWKDLGSILAYVHESFAFLSNVIIVDLDDCICKKITINKLYDVKNKATIEFDEILAKKLIKQSTDASIVIMSNQNYPSKLTIDSIKLKVEKFIEHTKIPILGFFALKLNSFSKPHTGMYRLLLAYYKSKSLSVRNVIIISNAGGMIITKETKKSIVEHVGYPDYDRAFASNIKCTFYTVDEYINVQVESRFLPNTNVVVRYEFNHSIIPPEVREIYANELDKKENTNIFKELGHINKPNYLIIIKGPPRSGKTTLANEIISKWRNSDYGKFNAIDMINNPSLTRNLNFYKKMISDRISIMIESSDELVNSKYIRLAKKHNAGVLIIIIDIGIEMAKVLNHVYVEESRDENVILHKLQEFNIYRSKYTLPKESDGKYIIYYPKIDRRDTVMKFRY